MTAATACAEPPTGPLTPAENDDMQLRADGQDALLPIHGQEPPMGADRNDEIGLRDLRGSASRVDLHCHSSASEVSRLGIQRAAGLPECATPPEEVYELAKRRGMDFVTITDHDTIDGVLEIVDQPDVFVSEELTAHFRGEPQAVHVLCWGIDAEDHEWLQLHNGDVEECAEYMQEHEIACALAHPWFTVGAPLTASHRRRLAEMFAIWEIRNGARARELNMPAAIYIATRDGAGVGGSDDHAGVDIGRTWTETPAARTSEELLSYIRAGEVMAKGAQGSAAKWAHAAIALAARSLDWNPTGIPAQQLDPRTVLTMVRRLMVEGDARHGETGADITPEDARGLLRAWLDSVELGHLDGRRLIALMQQEDFSHSALYRRACRAHERKLRTAVDQALDAIAGRDRIENAAAGLFEGCIAAIPYAPATAFLANERAKLDRHDAEAEVPRVAILADGIGNTHGVTRTIEEIRHRGVPGFEIEVLGTDHAVDRRLSAVAEIDVPFYEGLSIGVPSLTSAVQTLTEGAFDAIHVCSPGPAGVAGALVARTMGLPLLGSYHTELTSYTALRSGQESLTSTMELAVSAFYGACDVVLSPSAASDTALAGCGVPTERVMRWDRGVDTDRFHPELRDPALLPAGRFNVLYSGRITREKGADLLADAFLEARRTNPRLHLVLAGGGPEEQRLRERMGEHATFLGWLRGTELARAYASADAFLFPSSTDTFGQVILEAQASGLPVVAVARGGPLSLVEHRLSGLLCEPDAKALAAAIVELSSSPLLRRRLSTAALANVRSRTWDAALQRLADGYRRMLTAHIRAAAVRAA
ncbi:MAG TPA: glycosyltransferase [Solirubrobacteraceae bacterium]|jgi:glycosyltransferase involved in cell wall biosynthesis/predicted metal-dependent phosphoesterase TrpH